MKRPRTAAVKVLGTCDGKTNRTLRGTQLVEQFDHAKARRKRAFTKNYNKFMFNKVFNPTPKDTIVNEEFKLVVLNLLAIGWVLN